MADKLWLQIQAKSVLSNRLKPVKLHKSILTKDFQNDPVPDEMLLTFSYQIV